MKFLGIPGSDCWDHVSIVLKTSIATNLIIVIAMLWVAIASNSLSLLSSLAENLIDTFVQSMIWFASSGCGPQDLLKYPAGTSRFEPITIIVAACLMSICAVLVIQESSHRLYEGFSELDRHVPEMSVGSIIVVFSGIVTKCFAYYYSSRVAHEYNSPAVEAIAQDNRNDVISNTFAVSAYCMAAFNHNLWYVDSVGAICIFLFVLFSWGLLAREHIESLVGVRADDAFIEKVKEMSAKHHKQMHLDTIRAYHFGAKCMVELEVILPEDMTVKESHYIALQLQFKLEQLEHVERAFVHVDYKARDYDEHIVSRQPDALMKYAGSTANTPCLTQRDLIGPLHSKKEKGALNYGAVNINIEKAQVRDHAEKNSAMPRIDKLV
eukprot:gb/GEZN01009127.1/.p1 GENE.gb/GEZN01009127.1/~~gb/GEZN01009127.1/.p1  ORF type:complete len:380 (+),score=18.54 gb/GEZN01009127.1/:162-1301(+)